MNVGTQRAKRSPSRTRARGKRVVAPRPAFDLDAITPMEAKSVSQLPAFNRGLPAGPIWFQRMDRNNDGDLTWQEFLGHREDFYALDADRDGLIDPEEAEQAGKS